MNNNNLLIPIFESAIDFIKRNGASEDISRLFINADLPEGLMLDFCMEIALCAHPDEEVGVGRYSIEHIEAALLEYKKTGKTGMLEVECA